MMNTSQTSEDTSAGGSDVNTLIRDKILHVLEIFPYISNSMIHMAIGTSTPTILWKPILEQLVKEGLILETTITAKSPLDRQQTYTIYHLPKNAYNF